MIKSSLASTIIESPNYTKGRLGYKICKITPHHMAGILTAEQCANIFKNPQRVASSNYCIGNDGGIVCCVGEEDRAWTSNSLQNDCQAITIEVSNCELGGDWRVSDAAWNSLVKLCVDICQRNNFRLNYDGTANGSLTRHNMFANTACPGPYLQSRFQELADTVNAVLDGSSELPSIVDNNSQKISVKYQAYINDYWLTNVIDCNNTADGYAGIYGKAITGVKANTIGTVENAGKLTYRVHTLSGNWLDEVTDREKDKNGDNYAGLLGKSIDGVMIKASKGVARYRVHTMNGSWLPWVSGYNTDDAINGYAGNLGQIIDGLQIQIV